MQNETTLAAELAADMKSSVETEQSMQPVIPVYPVSSTILKQTSPGEVEIDCSNHQENIESFILDQLKDIIKDSSITWVIFRNTKLWDKEPKELEELRQKIETIAPKDILKVRLWYPTDKSLIEEAKLWSEAQKVNYFLLACKLDIFRCHPFTFPITPDTISGLLKKADNLKEEERRQIFVFLDSMFKEGKDIEPSKVPELATLLFFARIQYIPLFNPKEIAAGHYLDINKDIIISPTTIEKLLKIQQDKNISGISCEITNRTSEEIKLLSALITDCENSQLEMRKNAPQQVNREFLTLQIIDDNYIHGNYDRTLTLLQNIRVSIGKVEFMNKMISLEEPVSKILNFMNNISVIPNIKNFNFSYAKLNDLPEDILIIVIKALLSIPKIRGLSLYYNGIWNINLKSLSEIMNIMSDERFSSVNIRLFDSYELKGIDWDETRKYEFSKLEVEYYLKSKRIEVKPFSCTLNSTHEFELLQRYLSSSKEIIQIIQYSFGSWVSSSQLDYQQRLQLAKTCAAKFDNITLTNFRLESFDVHPLLLSLIEKNDEAFYQFEDASLHKTDFDFSKFWAAWVTKIKKEDFDEEIDEISIFSLIKDDDDIIPLQFLFNIEQAIDASGNSQTIFTGVIPELEKACQKVWKNNKFYEPCIEFLKNFAQRRIHDDYDVQKLFNMAKWFTYICVSLSINPNREIPRSAAILKEILRFAEPLMRYKLGKVWIHSIVNHPLGETIYQQLVAVDSKAEKDKPDNVARSIALPAVFLTHILLENSEEAEREQKEQIEQKETAKTILHLISNTSFYLEGSHLRPLIHAFCAIANYSLPIPKIQKLKLIQGVLEKELVIEQKIKEFITRLNKELQPEESIVQLQLRPNKEQAGLIKLDLTVEKSMDLKKCQEKLFQIFGERIYQTLPQKIINHQKQHQIKQTELNAIKRQLTSDFINQIRKAECKRQLSNWILIEGLALLNELDALVGKKCDHYDKVIFEIFAKLFKLDQERIKYYDSTFSGKRHEGGILLYLGKLRSLMTPDKQHLEQQYRERFVSSVLTEHASEFIRLRYEPRFSEHLTRLFILFPWIQDPWTQVRSFEVDLIDFIQARNIKPRFISKDYRKFVRYHVFDHKHAGDPKRFTYLASYFEMYKEPLKLSQLTKELINNFETLRKTGSALKSSIKNLEMELLSTKTYDRTILIRTNLMKKEFDEIEKNLFLLKLQECLIELMESSEKDIALQLKQLNQAKFYLRKSGKNDFETREFRQALENYVKVIKNENANMDLMKYIQKYKGSKIKLTDHFWNLFLCGTDVQDSCQAIFGNPTLNKNLVGFLLKGEIKIAEIVDKEDVISARAMVRIPIDEDEVVDSMVGIKPKPKPVLVVEEIYPHHLPSLSIDAINEFMSLIAAEFFKNIPVLVCNSPDDSLVSYPNPLTMHKGLEDIPEYVDVLHGEELAPYTIPGSKTRQLRGFEPGKSPGLHFAFDAKRQSYTLLFELSEISMAVPKKASLIS